MKNRLFKIFGITVIMFTLVANLQYALSDYGLSKKNYGSQLMAQNTTSVEVIDEAEESTSTSEGETPPPAQCYTVNLNFCFDTGVYSTQCTFTGRYGSPTSCFSSYCSVIENYLYAKQRRCVKKK